MQQHLQGDQRLGAGEKKQKKTAHSACGMSALMDRHTRHSGKNEETESKRAERGNRERKREKVAHMQRERGRHTHTQRERER